MKYSADMVFIGYENITKRGSTDSFTMALFNQGLETMTTFVSPELLPIVKSLQPYKPVKGEFKIVISKEKTFVNLENIDVVVSK